MNRLSVSVIIPTYNRAGFLPSAIDAALVQVGVQAEIIVVDDGSTDHTPDVVASYVKRHRHITYLQLPNNVGADGARRLGFQRSRGDCVAFLDSDDVWLPGHLQRCVRELDQHAGAAMAFTRYGVMDRTGHVLVDSVREPRLPDPPHRSLLFKRIIAQYSRVLYTRQAVRAVGGVPRSATADDWVLDVMIALRFPHGVIQVPERTVFTRYHESTSASNPARVRESLLRSAEQLFTVLPSEWQQAKPRVMAINLLHSAVVFWHAGDQGEAWRCFTRALKTDPSCVRDERCWSTLIRVSAHASVGRMIRALKHELQRRRWSTVVSMGIPRADQQAVHVLYLSYDGALEPLGQSQVVPYLRGLAARGAQVTLVSFEKRADLHDGRSVEALKRDLAASGICWAPLPYHKRPTVLATSCDVLVGFVRGWRLIRTRQIQIVHARSYVAAVIAWALKRLCRVRVIFDMRGFWADERVEGGLWLPGSRLYRIAKWCERRLLADADEVVTLTQRARLTVERWPGLTRPRVTVIPTCVDLARFSGAVGSGLNGRAPVFVYAGSVGTWYLLPEMAAFVARARRRWPGARLHVVTRDQRLAREQLRDSPLAPDAVSVSTVAHAQMPRQLEGCHAGLAFYKPGWSRQAFCPTKVGEYLAMGLPVVVNEAVGDMPQVIGANRVGAVLEAFTPEAYDQAIAQLERLWDEPDARRRCRRLAEAYFSLDEGTQRYWEVYERLR